MRGCAPAKLPPLATLAGKPGAVSPVDADPANQVLLHDELGKQLETLRGQVCKP